MPPYDGHYAKIDILSAGIMCVQCCLSRGREYIGLSMLMCGPLCVLIMLLHQSWEWNLWPGSRVRRVLSLSLSHVHGHIFFHIVGFVCCQGFSYRVCSNNENKMWCVDSDCWRQQGDGVMLKCSAILLVVLFSQIIDLPGINPVS
jgi:hypothetical protein